MFPTSNSVVYRNEAGEVLGWDNPTDDAMAYYCDMCGFSHAGPCPEEDEPDEDEDDDDDEETYRSIHDHGRGEVCHCDDAYDEAVREMEIPTYDITDVERDQRP
jgi:hypothetical protein